MIQLRDIHKKYGALPVLRGIDMDIAPGRITCIVGPSGAGKTTLLQILGTLERPDSGRIIYNDVDVSGLSDKRLSKFRNSNIGFVFQMHRLLPEFTLAENVALPALIGGVGKKEAMKRAVELLEKLQLKDRISHRPNELSGGEAQRGAVARALINNPQVVLADEPSGSLDSQNKRLLHKLFFDLRDDIGTTFVIVTHDESLAAEADVTVRITDGIIEGITSKIVQ